MNTTTATVTVQQSLSNDYTTSFTSTRSLTEYILKTLDDTEFDLNSILTKEFEQGLPSDLNPGI